MPDRSLREEELLVRLGWFIKIRWLFLVGLALAVATGRFLLEIRFPADKALAVGAVVFSYNLGFYVYHRLKRGRPAPDLVVSRIEAYLQIGLDLLALTFLIHYTGGAQNPFIFFYLFHAILACMLLPRTEVWILGMVACGMFLSVVVLEYFEIIPHHQLEGLFASTSHLNLQYLFVVSLGLMITLFTTIYMSSAIVHSLRAREKELVVTQKMLQKKSSDLEETYARLVESQKQLVQSEKLASLGQLVSGIAHEINNPIQFMLGNMQVFKEAMGDILPILDDKENCGEELKIARLKYPFFREQIQVLIKDMADGAGRIRDIVRDLKTFARRDEGQLDEEVDLNQVVEASERLVHNKIKHYRVEQDLAESLPKLRGSTNRLVQVVVNTLINAADALGERGDAVIRVVSRQENGGRQVRLSISDNGPGMTDEVKGRLFDPFFTTKQRTGGTGLGMSIAYGIIEEHGGRIEVDTRLGEGSVFHYILPVAGSRL